MVMSAQFMHNTVRLLKEFLMLSEKDMEDAIAQNPQKFIGESGLKLLFRQYRIGNYIFDLMFVDKYGTKLIVELQKGTLDRVHTYKILDYYDEYKEQNPNEFIELMVIANKVPMERKKRLKSWGVTFKEIPENEFEVLENIQTNFIEKPTHNKQDEFLDKSYMLFKKQKNLFIEKLLDYNPDIEITMNWNELSETNIKKRTNWFVCFIPKQWGKPKNGFGIHFGFIHQRDRNSTNEFIRLTVGVEKPLDPEFNEKFKSEIREEILNAKINISNIAIYPNAGYRKGGKLVEIERVPLNEDSYKILFNNYKNLNEVIAIISSKIKEYYSKDRFMGKLEFTA